MRTCDSLDSFYRKVLLTLLVGVLSNCLLEPKLPSIKPTQPLLAQSAEGGPTCGGYSPHDFHGLNQGLSCETFKPVERRSQKQKLTWAVSESSQAVLDTLPCSEGPGPEHGYGMVRLTSPSC